MQQIPFLHTALKDRPRIFQTITVFLFSFFISTIVVCVLAATQKRYSNKLEAGYTGHLKTKTAYPK